MMQIPLSILAPFGTPRILDNLMEAVLINALIRLAEELNSRPPKERRRMYADMHPDIKTLISEIQRGKE